MGKIQTTDTTDTQKIDKKKLTNKHKKHRDKNANKQVNKQEQGKKTKTM